MKSQKIGSALLVTAMVPAMLLTGCGSDGSSSKDGASPSAGAAATQAPKLEPREISIYFEGTSAQKDTAMVEAAVNKITKEKINATVKLNHLSWSEFGQKMNLKIAGGEPFDIMFTAGFDNFAGNVAKGAFMALNDPKNNLLEKYGKDILATIDPIFLTGTSINGINYAVPTQKEYAAQQGFMIQKELVEKHKFDLSQVKKLNDLEPILQTIKEKEPSITAVFNASSNWLYYITPYEMIGAKESVGVISKTDTGAPKVVNQFETPEFKEMAQLFVKWNKMGFFQKDPATNTILTADSKAGKVAVEQFQLKPGKAEEQSIGYEKAWVQHPLTETFVSTGDLNGSMLAISKTSKDPERAMMLLNLLHSDKELVNLMNFGLEGTHYVKVPGQDNMIKYPEGKTAKDVGYSPGLAWQTGNQFLSYLFENENPQKWENFKKFNKEGKPSRVLGYSYDNTKVKNEEAAIASIVKSYVDGLAAGVLDVEKALAEFNDKLKKAGSDKVIAEKQRQIDEFLKSKK